MESYKTINHSFIIVWAGSIISVIITLIMGIMALSGTEIYLLIFASIMYLFGVQLPTFRFNIPLNNSLQNLEIEALDESQASLSRTDFEISLDRRWNRIRTVNAIITVSILLLLILP